MFGDDGKDRGIFDRLIGISSIDEKQKWREVRQDGKNLKNRSKKIRSQADSLRSVESNEIADPQAIAEDAGEAAEQAMNVYQGAKVAVNANNENALEDGEAYDIIESVQVKVEGLAEDLTESYESVVEYGEETYQQFKGLLENDMGLGVDVELPDTVNWESGKEVGQTLREVKKRYKDVAEAYRRKASPSQNGKENDEAYASAEDRAEQYREIREDLEDSMFEEEYRDIADTLEEKAETEEPVTPIEKAEKAEGYASIAEFAKSHISDVQDAAAHISEAETKAYQVSDNLASLMRGAGYSRENEAGEWRQVD